MNRLQIYLFDLLLLLGAFFTIHYAKYGNLAVAERHHEFFVYVLVFWLATTVGVKKFSLLDQRSFSEGSRAILVSCGLMLGVISLLIVLLGLQSVSRLLVYGTILLYALLEMASFAGYRYATSEKNGFNGKRPQIIGRIEFSFNPSVSLALSGFVLLLIAFSLVTLVKRGEFQWAGRSSDVLSILIGLWLFTALVLKKYNKTQYHSPSDAVAMVLRSALVMAAALAVIVFGFRYFYLSRGQLFGTLLVYSIFEFGPLYLYSRYKSYEKWERKQAEVVQDIMHQAQLQMSEPSDDEPCSDPVDEKMRHALHFFDPELYSFIRESVDLSAIDSSRCELLHADNLLHLQMLENNGSRVIVNLQKINDLRFLNQYFLLAHAKLKIDGVLVGKAHTLETHRHHFFEKYPQPFFGKALYVVDFIWHRAFPKMPVLKKAYFSVTRGRNRLLSKSEILGRLTFCGFHPIAQTHMNNRLYFIAQKDRTPSQDASPTYGPLVGLNRIGYRNNPITVYKFRTMHPYSEYIQGHVYEGNQLEKGGKIKNDYRVTSWGRFMRRFWLDELPMLYNWLRGDLQLVGVRPLSRQYLALYSPGLRHLRTQVKPGLLPPFYADMPTTLEEIQASEERYIRAYLARPLTTQFRYFFHCLYNILIKRARSA